MEKWYAGSDQFVWFVAVVENRSDPLALGRLQIRIFGIHNASLVDIPSENLPWATVIQAGNNSREFSVPEEAQIVIGFFLDGTNKQNPIIWGVIPGFATVPPNTGSGFNDLRSEAQIKLAPKKLVGRQYSVDGSGIKLTEANTANSQVLESLRHPNSSELNNQTITGMSRYQQLDNTIIAARKLNLDKGVKTAKGVQWSEPYPSYNPLYPLNSVVETESGHALELDDTPGSERVALSHRTGTYFEVFPSGTKVEKITKSNYQIIMADDHLHVMGHVMVTVDSDVLIKTLGSIYLEVGNDVLANVSGDMNLTVGGSLDIKAKSLNIDIADDATLVTGGDQYLTAKGDINSSAGGQQLIGADGDVDINAGGDVNIESAGSFFMGGSSGSGISIGSSESGSGIGINAGGPFNVSGTPINLNSGAVSIIGSATKPTIGTVAGLPEAAPVTTPNHAIVPNEPVPVPLPGAQAELDPFTGAAFVHQQFLQKKSDGTLGEPTPILAPQPCNFDANTRTFISDPQQWNISEDGLALIESFEGFAKVVSPNMVTAYVDPATGGQPYTIGYGTTEAAIGIPVTLGELISRATAQEYIDTAIGNEFLPTLQRVVTVPVTQAMIDAMLSLMYNIGSGNFSSSSVVKYLNMKNYCSAGDAFLLWNRAAGQVLPGLTSRRTKERTIFLA